MVYIGIHFQTRLLMTLVLRSHAQRPTVAISTLRLVRCCVFDVAHTFLKGRALAFFRSHSTTSTSSRVTTNRLLACAFRNRKESFVFISFHGPRSHVGSGRKTIKILKNISFFDFYITPSNTSTIERKGDWAGRGCLITQTFLLLSLSDDSVANATHRLLNFIELFRLQGSQSADLLFLVAFSFDGLRHNRLDNQLTFMLQLSIFYELTAYG